MKSKKPKPAPIAVEIETINPAKSICICGHTGDGTGSKHHDRFPGSAVAAGHGGCVLCRCQKFSWNGWLPWYSLALEAKVKAELEAKAALRAKALEVLEGILNDWGDAVDDADAEIQGSDAVDALCSIVRAAQDILRRPGYVGELKIEGEE